MVLHELLLKFLYPLPSSLFIIAMSIITFASLAHSGFQESQGKNMQYAKFFNVGTVKTDKKAKLSGRTGMLIFYTPAFLASVASFALLPNEGLRFALLRLALAIHFFKRVLEVLHLHAISLFLYLSICKTINKSAYFVWLQFYIRILNISFILSYSDVYVKLYITNIYHQLKQRSEKRTV